ncbi:hypothetical protein M758_5G071200 [Ceratodon purpureus]|nr:hypothetical protein M758_5G071200 [Ceratodon purpureus]
MAKSRGVVRRVTSLMVRKDGVKLLTMWMAMVVAALPVLTPSLFSASSWETSLFSEWEPPTARHGALLDSLQKTRLLETEPEGLWDRPDSGGWMPCARREEESSRPAVSNGYLQVFLEGGLNQQRMGICDAVVVAKILNATLLLPHFDVNPVWKDSSSFADIFDVEHFLDTLKLDVEIVTELPREFEWSTREYYATGYRATRVKNAPVQASPEWYITNVLPLMQSSGVVAVAPFSHRLAFNDLPAEIQRLRCKVNFEALRFVPSINRLGNIIVERLRQSQARNVDGDAKNPKYLALHLRFDKDMAAHSACDFGGGKAERLALAKYRSVVWQGRVSNALLSDKELRDKGKCPMTPEEVGIMLAALGFGHETRVYLASYTVYGGSARMEFLRTLFPGMNTKHTLATAEELQPFEGKASQLAAIDYLVSLQSDIFFSASRGNMHNSLAAHRTYLNVRKTIKPDMNLMARLFTNNNLTWPEFRRSVIEGHRNRMGQVTLRQPTQSIYTYPAPDCMCTTRRSIAEI